MLMIKAGNDVMINIDDVLSIFPTESVEAGTLDKALDLSGGTKRSVVITKSGRIYLLDARCETLRTRIEEALSRQLSMTDVADTSV